ncbi:MAG: alpha/beta hydrolase [Steroidobacteraceae bacterium]
MTTRRDRTALLATLAALAALTAAAQSTPTDSAQPAPIGPAPAAATACEPASAGTITWDEILAKYADPDSKFVVLEGNDGIRVHYKDQGSGPAVLLIHSSMGDLKDWDGWVEVLSRSYRVVRLDLPAFGLTGPVPSGNYSIDRYLTLVDALMDTLGIERFAIVGTSYGGLLAFRYAATRIDRITALVLANSAGVEYGGRKGTSERARNPQRVFTPEVKTNAMVEASLKGVINDPGTVTPAMVQRKTDYGNVIGRDREAFVATQLYERGNPQRVLSRVRAPALVLWGGNSRGLSPETAQAFVDAMTHAKSTQKIIYEGGGHLLHIERPAQTVQDVKAFLDRQVREGGADA